MTDALIQDVQSEEVEHQQPASLESLGIHRSRFVYAEKNLYRVYDQPDHYQLVDADSAYEAFEKSGLTKAVKIQREAFYHYVAISPELLEEGDHVIELNPQLPSLEERQILLDAALLESDDIGPVKLFEEISLRNLTREAIEEAEAQKRQQRQEREQRAADEAAQQQETAEMQPQPEESTSEDSMPESQPPEEPHKPQALAEKQEPVELSPDEVNALLNDESE